MPALHAAQFRIPSRTQLRASGACHDTRPARSGLLRSGHFGAVWRALAARRDLLRQRRALADLDDRLLADIGISRAEAEAEARRPLWDAPAR